MKLKKYLAGIVWGIFLMTRAHAQNDDVNNYALMTARDMGTNVSSNVSLTNHTANPVTVSGLFIASFDMSFGDCSICTGSVVSGDNLGGAVVSPVTFKKDQSVPIGQNYLYNMIYNGIYYIKNTAGSSPCSLPGCSWPGDDTTNHGWCISINAVSLGSNYTHSTYTNDSHPPASAPSYGSAGNSDPYNYKYDLIDPNTLGTGNACIGPVVCDDKTLTCKVSTAQHETFQPY